MNAKKNMGYPVEFCCGMFGVSRAAYYRWGSGKNCAREMENEKIAKIVEQIHTLLSISSNFFSR